MISQISVPHHHAEQAQNHRPQPIWRCAVCKERRPAGSPHDAQDIYRQPEKCDACGSRELRGPYLPVDVPYRLHEEAYGTLRRQGTTARKRLLRVLRDEVRHELDDRGLRHGRCLACNGLAVGRQGAWECLECGNVASGLRPPPIPSGRPGPLGCVSPHTDKDTPVPHRPIYGSGTGGESMLLKLGGLSGGHAHREGGPRKNSMQQECHAALEGLEPGAHARIEVPENMQPRSLKCLLARAAAPLGLALDWDRDVAQNGTRFVCFAVRKRPGLSPKTDASAVGEPAVASASIEGIVMPPPSRAPARQFAMSKAWRKTTHETVDSECD
jgi:hypothetical protein